MQVEQHSKIIGIELLRFVSAFAVLVWHYQHFAFGINGIDIQRDAQPFYNLLSFFYNYGANGVQVFWCVSGFIFFYKYLDALSAGRMSFAQFSLNRFSRLYPLHAITLLLVALLQPAYELMNGYYFVYPFNDIKHFLLNVLLISHWGFESGFSFNAPIWSVSVEIVVYLAFFALVSRLALIPAYAAAGGLLVLLLFFGRYEMAQCLAYFFVGGALAVCRFQPGWLFRKDSGKSLGFVVCGLVLVSTVTGLYGLRRAGLYQDQVAWLFQLSFVALLVHLFVLCNRFFLFAPRLWIFLGNLTYASYLMHFPIQLGFAVAFSWLGVTLDYRSSLLFVFFLTLTFVLSALTYKFVEMPLQHTIRKRFRGRREGTPADGLT